VRRVVGLIVVAAAILTVSGSAEAAERLRFQESAKGGNALFTDCPDVPRNLTCTFTSIFASRFKGKDAGDRFAGASVFVDVVTVGFDATGLGTLVTERFGFADAEVSVRGRLAKASVDTVVPLCDTASGACTNTRVKAEWRAAGERLVERVRFVDMFNGIRIKFSGRFVFRPASVTASLGGRDLGPSGFAAIFYTRVTEILDCEDTCNFFEEPPPELRGVGDTTKASPRAILRSHAS
jgi:hypothetical protein